MSLIQKLYDAQESKDLEKYNEVLSEDYYWLNTQQVSTFLKKN